MPRLLHSNVCCSATPNQFAEIANPVNMRHPKSACLLLLVFLMSFSIPTIAGRKLRVLFIGNSYTYTNNLPQLVANMAASAGDTLIYDSYAPGGYRFADHAIDSLCLKKIKSSPWNYIVMQEQSQLPSRPLNSFFINSYYWAYALDTMIAAAKPCANRMFFMTWGYKNGDAANCAAFPEVCTYAGMDSMINLHYRGFADTAVMQSLGVTFSPATWGPPIRTAQVSPVGAVWRYVRQQHPGIDLYQTDGSHPSEAGSYAAACTFYAALFRHNPALSNYNFTLAVADADKIKKAAKLLVYDSLYKWRIGMDDGELRADMKVSKAGGNLVILLSQSTPMNSNQWSFGDGTTETGSSAFHTYSRPGIYTVRVIASRGGCRDTAYETVSTIPSGIGSAADVGALFRISPNPAGNGLRISAENAQAQYAVRVTNSIGQLTYEGMTDASGNMHLDLSAYSPGLYSIQLFKGGVAVYRGSFLKQ